MKKMFIALATLLLTGTAFAQDSTEKATAESRSTANQYSTSTSEAGWFPSVGVDFGHMDQTGNADEDGEGVSVKAVGTYYFPNSAWLADAGLGIHKQYFEDSDNPVVGLISFSGRYQFPRRFSVGPVFDSFLGTGDEYGSSNDYLAMIGLVGMKEVAFANDSLGRFGLKYSTEFGIEDQSNDYLGLVFEWGIGSQNTLVRQATAMNE
ncbi:MAG: hypothetical protein ACAH59_00010 [Pseudobdellovibrionaceae bacterium]